MRCRHTAASFVTLICEARRLSANLKSAFLFMLWANSFVALTQLLSQISVLPPILTGYQVVWLVAIPIPILTIGLLTSPPHPGKFPWAAGSRGPPDQNLIVVDVYLLTEPSFVPVCAPRAWVCPPPNTNSLLYLALQGS